MIKLRLGRITSYNVCYTKLLRMVSLLLRPVVCPEVKGVITEKSMELRYFAPGSLVSNLDFVESIFGNAGDHRNNFV